MKISKVEKVKFRKGMFKISFENSKKSLAISADSIVKFTLKIGVDISEDVCKRILFYDKSKSGIFKALSLVSKRSYSVKNLQNKLIQRGYGLKNSVGVVERLKELNYLNDEEYAKNYAVYLSGIGKGEFLIRAELEKQGIERSLINSALGVVKASVETSDKIAEILKAKFKNFDKKNKIEVRKATSFFLRRGFSFEDIAKAFKLCRSVM
ncbi:MAG: recombination regulator RecX [Endomicrobium sp.]|nr:recombination regulator RecX [Endomicrobium sp.]